MRRPVSLRHRLEHLAVAGIRRAQRSVPHRLVLGFGAALGLAFYALDRLHRRVALANLAAAFPRRSAAERRAIARAAFAHFGRLLVELLRFGSLSRERLLELVEFEGEDRVWNAYSQKRGVLLFSGHFGFWELQGIVHGLHFRPIGVLARALDNPLLNAELERLRGHTGNSVIYRRGAIRPILRALQSGEGVALLIDQHIQSADAVYVDFFNRPAATTSALAAIALRTGAPVIPLFALPLPGGRYRMIYDHAVEPPAPDSADRIREFTQRCTDVLEMYVRRHPELWLWMHRRWRDVGGEPARGMFPTAGGDSESEVDAANGRATEG